MSKIDEVKKILPSDKQHEGILAQFSKRFPLEFVSLDLNFGIFKVQFRHKKQNRH